MLLLTQHSYIANLIMCMSTWAACGSSPQVHWISGLFWLVSSESLLGVDDPESSWLLTKRWSETWLKCLSFVILPKKVHFPFRIQFKIMQKQKHFTIIETIHNILSIFNYFVLKSHVFLNINFLEWDTKKERWYLRCEENWEVPWGHEMDRP